MSQLTDQMNAAIANLKSSQTGLSADQVNTVVAQAVAPLQNAITQITTSEKSDEDKLADVTAAVTEFTTAFAPTTPATPVADSTPVTPAPAPAPDAAPVTPAPDATPVAPSPAPAA